MNVTQACIIENSAVVLLARILSDSGAVVTAADVSTFTAKVFDLADDSLISSPTLVKTDCFHSTLQTTDPRWTVDGIGFNMEAKLSGANFPGGGRKYRVELHVTPVSGDAYYILYNLDTINILSE